MTIQSHREKANFIWQIADLLRGNYKQSEYGKIILPLTVLRRLDQILEPTKAKVLQVYDDNKKQKPEILEKLLNKAAKQKFHNRSKFDFKKLAADPNGLEKNLRNYINGFSAGAKEIFDYFQFEDEIEKLDKENLLYLVIKDFAKQDLSDLDTMQMGYVFEELIRKFSELSNETAGEHFTPREVIRLMVDLLFIGDNDILRKEGIIRTLYDPACGTGGMLSVAEAYVQELNPNARLEVFGQEINDESYAICKGDMLIKGQNPGNIKYGDTFTKDGLENELFDYMLCNPPFGVEWKKQKEVIEKEHDDRGFAGRFGPGLPRINDGSLLFLLHMISKMKKDGSRIGIVFNGSPLFTGSAGSGESEIRKWIIENDMLEAIVAMPDQLFYNTGIATYVWILTNRKAKKRKGKVQLINAVSFFEKMTRSLGNKRNLISETQLTSIAKIYGSFKSGEFCKIFDNEDFGYARITVERPAKDEKGQVLTDKNGNPKADSELRDYENVPLTEKIETYFKREVLPHVPDAWVDESKTKIGYEINFTKYFYQYKPLRSLSEIRADILALKKETEGMIREVIK
ncbi:MAG TPA: class I SAM-dependent DNA methyltransferase [bacterium]|nr:class I SAM-dependent DNA methyltransferase [bacterium]HMW35233.1 class I SAM-dependent DNA methyltransferase [bacterium]HMY35674.1 class I SAM-dependent DNA methyltransferase [bacterium]HMZ03532.1 class I SAM-dependent DNA methyltransferase [bacterium]HNB08091.1 class I SAM-dependent DNA methyltransferase [bacterium]